MLLTLSIVALLAGPAIYTLGKRNQVARQVLDGFIFITIAGIVGSAPASSRAWSSELGRNVCYFGRDQRDFRQRGCTENRGAIRLVMV